MELPEQVWSVSSQTLELLVLEFGDLHWHGSHAHDEENNSQGVDISLSTLIGASSKHLWCHVAGCSNLAFNPSKALSSNEWNHKAEVCDLHSSTSLCEEHVVWLKVTMCHASVMEVVHGLEHLLEIVSADSLVEA